MTNEQMKHDQLESDQLEVGVSYPCYQLYKDSSDNTYCSSKKLKGHAEGNQWIKDCLAAHPGTSTRRIWTSDSQSGTVWSK